MGPYKISAWKVTGKLKLFTSMNCDEDGTDSGYGPNIGMIYAPVTKFRYTNIFMSVRLIIWRDINI